MQGAKFVDVEGIRTRYFTAGKGEPVVFVNGADFGQLGHAENWGLVFDEFAKHFRVYAFDKIGQGYTDNPKTDRDYLKGTQVKHLYDFIKTMGIQPASIMGVSRGGYDVCRLTLEHPEVVKTVTIIDSATLMSRQGGGATEFYQEVKRKADQIADPRERARYSLTANSFSGKWITEQYIDTELEIMSLPKIREAEAKMNGPGYLEGPLAARFVEDMLARRKETQGWLRAGRLTVPTLIMWGYNDPSALLEPMGLDALRLIFAHNPRSQMHILNQAGHFCYSEQPRAFAAIVTAFIKSSSSE
ncbi:MAG: alpha/beta hydrolase [Chloroflexi bacterium]|nr:alpha/beta hydrolase [Chloroflexota bacterium]